jgi:hypothetical protein
VGFALGQQQQEKSWRAAAVAGASSKFSALAPS